MADRLKDEHIDVIMRKLRPARESEDKYPPLEPGVMVEDGIRIERDVAVRMRDGVTIYTDIYRPDSETNLPAIVAWSPYGKRAGYSGKYLPGAPLGFIPGVPMGTCSRATKFEGPDPGFWCRYGYAVINPDARGAGNSEGDVRFWSNAEGEDCHDLIEWVAARDWSNGKVGMTGNSWLAIAQWFAAAEQPPHLTCIAPWEGITDFYRDLICRGGVPETGFWDLVYHGSYGTKGMEDVVAMIRKYPLMNSYWEDKIAHLDKINIPAYMTAGWNHFHLHGCFDGFRNIASTNKWMRAHREFEWPDSYTPQNLDDLLRFFDRYLKGIRNGWEMTPKVRIEVMDYGEVAWQVNRPEKEFPLARTQYEASSPSSLLPENPQPAMRPPRAWPTLISSSTRIPS
jgi:predicted acyl esterase